MKINVAPENLTAEITFKLKQKSEPDVTYKLEAEVTECNPPRCTVVGRILTMKDEVRCRLAPLLTRLLALLCLSTCARISPSRRLWPRPSQRWRWWIASAPTRGATQAALSARRLSQPRQSTFRSRRCTEGEAQAQAEAVVEEERQWT